MVMISLYNTTDTAHYPLLFWFFKTNSNSKHINAATYSGQLV